MGLLHSNIRLEPSGPIHQLRNKTIYFQMIILGYTQKLGMRYQYLRERFPKFILII